MKAAAEARSNATNNQRKMTQKERTAAEQRAKL